MPLIRILRDQEQVLLCIDDVPATITRHATLQPELYHPAEVEALLPIWEAAGLSCDRVREYLLCNITL